MADLPNGTIVAIAANAGGGNEENGLLDAELAGAVAGLVGHEGLGPDIDASTSAEEASKSKVFTLVGWKGKGDGPREWARRQNRCPAEGDDDDDGSGRCALYAELVLTPPPLAAEDRVVAAPKLVELKDKLCLCPLRSVPGDDDPTHQSPVLPARGVCRRTGEPTVSVGPAVDLVDCPGWTTVLQAPSEEEKEVATGTDGVEKKDPQPPAAWMVTTVYPAVGSSHEDTEEFDDGPVG